MSEVQDDFDGQSPVVRRGIAMLKLDFGTVPIMHTEEPRYHGSRDTLSGWKSRQQRSS